MGDNLLKAGAQDCARINDHGSRELEYWTRAHGVSEEELASAVKAVGPAVRAVREYLRK